MGIAAAVAAFFTFLGTTAARLILGRVLLFLGLKALLVVMFTTLVPILMINFIGSMMDASLAAMSNMSFDGYGGTAQFTGLLGWLLDCFQVPEALAVIISALQLHLILKMIPFSPIK